MGLAATHTILSDNNRAQYSFFLEGDYTKRESDAFGFQKKDSATFTPFTYNYTYHKLQFIAGMEGFVIPSVLSLQLGVKVGSVTFTGRQNGETKQVYLSKNASNPDKDYINAQEFDNNLDNLGWIITPIPPFFIPQSFEFFLGMGVGSGRVSANIRYNLGAFNLHRRVSTDKKVWERGFEFSIMLRLQSKED